MAAGYNRPANPAVVSGPGALSRRTDGHVSKMQLPDANYGENADFQEIQSGASMNAPASPTVSVAPNPGPQVVGLGEPSQMPDEPVTAGAEYGSGPGPDVLGLDPNATDLEQYGKYMPYLLRLANDPNTAKSTRTAIRLLFAKS